MNNISPDLDIINTSPAINSGTNLGWVIGNIDFAGNPRVDTELGMVDIGAYEHVIPEPGIFWILNFGFWIYNYRRKLKS